MKDYDWKTVESEPVDLDRELPRFDLVATKWASYRDSVKAQLNADLFRDGLSLERPRVPWRMRVRIYFSTLWMAIRGIDPYDY